MNLYKISIVLLVIFLTGCLDDDKYALDPSGYKNVIEFLDPSVPSNPAGAIYPVWTRVTEIQSTFEFEQVISFSGPNSNNQDIDLELEVDPRALDAYNQQMENDLHGGLYTLMPESLYTFTEKSVTIPKGEKTAKFSITVFPDQFDLSKTYAIPVRIVSASSGILSAQFSTALLAVVVKNEYDGIYEVIGGSITRNTADGPDTELGGFYPTADGKRITVALATVNATTVALPDSPPLWKDGSNVGGIAGTKFEVSQTINPDDKTYNVTITSTNATLKATPATLNIYTPVDDSEEGQNKPTFLLSFDWGSAPATRIIADLKLRYLRPR